MDSGDIIAQRSIRIMPNFTSGILYEKLSVLGRDLLMETLPSIIDGTNSRTPQDEHMVTYAYNLKREEERINWNLSMAEIDAHVRAFSPEPGCYTTIDGKNLKILSVEKFACDNFEEVHSSDPNGLIVKIFKDSIAVKVLDGIIKITAVQLEGKTKQRVKVFLNGSGRNLIAVQKQFK